MPTTTLKPPPKFVTNEWAWAYTLNKLAEKDQLDDGGNPRNYAAAVAIYKHVARKYGDPGHPFEDDQDLTRAQIISFQMPIWHVSRGFAWAANDEAMQRIWHDVRGWHIERETTDDLIAGQLDTETVEWLVHDWPHVLAWAREVDDQ